jgi:UDP-glucose 4,6-dehydratase
MDKIVITGGAGFVGSHIVERCVREYPRAEIIVLDKMTYAADIRNLLPLMTARHIELMVGDVQDLETCLRAVKGADLVIHAAAESHVDNSFGNSFAFTKTNVVGTHSIMESCRQAGVKKIVHVSTDEVYGEVRQGFADEDTVLRPTNPYSASKAAAEMIVNGYRQSYKSPVIVVRANNIFGIRQYPEKILPKFIVSLIMGRKLTIHGDGSPVRHFLAAPDMAEAIELVAEQGELGGVYNIGTTEEYANLEVRDMICGLFGLEPAAQTEFVADRLFNDARYALKWDRIQALGWKPKHSLKAELPTMAQWYMDNLERYEDPARAVRRP